MLFKSKVEKAFDVLRGYCDKHLCCEERCKLYDTEVGTCVLRTDEPVCDLNFPGRGADNGS